MLALPNRGISRSVKRHNIDMVIFCDWLEGTCLFCEEDLSQMDVVDTLLEEEVYLDQDFASAIVHDAWNEIERRASLCGDSYGVSIREKWMRPAGEWKEVSAHAFCLLLATAGHYDWWSREIEIDYDTQGELFELLTMDSLRALAPSWEIYRSGWSKAHTTNFKDLAKEVASRIRSKEPDVESWNAKNPRDMELDLLWYWPFLDGNEGFPYFLVQCTTGLSDCKRKARTPDLRVWTDIVRPATQPMRGFAVPFCYSSDEFRRFCVRVGGFFLDRCRLLSAARWDANWLSADLSERMCTWSEQKVAHLIARSWG